MRELVVCGNGDASSGDWYHHVLSWHDPIHVLLGTLAARQPKSFGAFLDPFRTFATGAYDVARAPRQARRRSRP
jgi:hypothetical protein